MTEQLIFDYISVWGWVLLSMIFLVGGLVVFSLPNNLITNAISVSLIVSSLGCFAMVIKRKKELRNEVE